MSKAKEQGGIAGKIAQTQWRKAIENSKIQLNDLNKSAGENEKDLEGYTKVFEAFVTGSEKKLKML